MKKWQSLSSTQQSTAQGKWVSCTAATLTQRFESSPPSTCTCVDPSVPSHSKWQGLETSNPLTLLIVDYGPEVLRGKDADGVTQGTSAKFNGNSATPWKFLQHPRGSSILRPYKTMGEPKSGPCPNKHTSFFFSTGCSNSTSLMSIRLASSMKHHSPFVQLPAKWTKVVTMGAPLNRYGFEIFLWLSIVFKDSNGLRVVFSCWPMTGDSMFSVQKNDSGESLLVLIWGRLDSLAGLWCGWSWWWVDSIIGTRLGEQPLRWKGGQCWW